MARSDDASVPEREALRELARELGRTAARAAIHRRLEIDPDDPVEARDLLGATFDAAVARPKA